ncbi:hypothetical protein H1C71_006325, partial [Ictidomys tridecemlineatus]
TTLKPRGAEARWVRRRTLRPPKPSPAKDPRDPTVQALGLGAAMTHSPQHPSPAAQPHCGLRLPPISTTRFGRRDPRRLAGVSRGSAPSPHPSGLDLLPPRLQAGLPHPREPSLVRRRMRRPDLELKTQDRSAQRGCRAPWEHPPSHQQKSV